MFNWRRLLIDTAPTNVTSPVGTTQHARPNNDAGSFFWTPSTGTNLWSLLDETFPDDSDYIQSDVVTDIPESLYLSLSPLDDPLSSTGHVLKLRFGKTEPGGDAVNMTVTLMQDDETEIATRTFEDISDVLTTHSFTLSQAEANTITNYEGLLLKLTVVKG